MPVAFVAALVAALATPVVVLLLLLFIVYHLSLLAGIGWSCRRPMPTGSHPLALGASEFGLLKLYPLLLEDIRVQQAFERLVLRGGDEHRLKNCLLIPSEFHFSASLEQRFHLLPLLVGEFVIADSH